MPFKHDGQRRPVGLGKFDFILFGGADLHDALPLLDDEGRARGSVLHLPVGPRKYFLSVLHDLDLCRYEP